MMRKVICYGDYDGIDVRHMGIYDVVEYYISDKHSSLDTVTIINDRGIKQICYMKGWNGEELFKDYTIEYRNDIINTILE